MAINNHSGKRAVVGAVRAASSFFELAFEAVWPDRCLVCEASLIGKRGPVFRWEPPIDALLCDQCKNQLVSPANAFCKRCAVALPSNAGVSRCGKCADADWYYSEVRPLHEYSGLARSVVLALKRTSNRALVETIARLYFSARERELRAFAPDCVVAVPMYWQRKYFLRHGVNAPDKLAKRLAKSLRVPCMSRYLRRTRATASQTSLGWSERATNVRGAFAAKPRVFVGKRVLLVDDAFTTGATANEISRILLDAGAIVVCVAVLTRASVALAPRS